MFITNKSYKQEPDKCPYCKANKKVEQPQPSLHAATTEYTCGFSVVGLISEKQVTEYTECETYIGGANEQL